MRKKVVRQYLRCKDSFETRVKNALSDERGAADIVAIIVVIVIILAVAVIFRTQLTQAVTSVFEKLNDFIG